MATEQDREFLKQMADFQMPEDPLELRKTLEGMLAMFNANPPDIGAFHEGVELRPGLRADISVPKGAGPFPVVLYNHGGGWVAGSPRSHRVLGMQFAEAGYVCVNLDYRLAPEHPFPAGLDDIVFASTWLADNAKRWAGDASRLAMGGDSAGGNLTAAALTSMAARKIGPKFRGALLLYGVYDFPATINRSANPRPMESMARAYAGANYPAALNDPRVSPLGAVKPGSMPPSFVICGTADDLVPESKALADALRRADIRCEEHYIEEMPHGFMQVAMLSGCAEGLKLMFDFLNRTA